MSNTYKCLCEKSSVTIKGELPKTQIGCHCSDCSLTSGSAFSSNIILAESDVSFNGQIGTFDKPGASGNPVTRIFCKSCGCALGHNSVTFGDKLIVQTGILGFENVPYETELFVESRWAGVPALAPPKADTPPPRL